MFLKKKIIWSIAAILIVAVIAVAAVNVYVFEKGNRYILTSVDSVPVSQTAIILGAAILKNKSLSPVLKDRVDVAIKLFKAGKVSKLLMTGDDSTIINDEVSPVRRYLVAAGIPAEDIFLDHAGFDTYSSMYRAESIFEVGSVIIVTQEFHLPRALFIARSLGLNAYGMVADRGDYSIKNYLREMLARPKAFLDVLFHRKPQYLGAPYPITGDGQTTWN